MTPSDFKIWRKAIGLSQAAAAKALGLSTPTIEMYEAGTRFGGGRSAAIPKIVALACAALYYRLDQWSG
jgi:transcriptional regulator with XRE-family HTH domain